MCNKRVHQRTSRARLTTYTQTRTHRRNAGRPLKQWIDWMEKAKGRNGHTQHDGMTTTTLRRPRSRLLMVSRWSVNHGCGTSTLITITGVQFFFYYWFTGPIIFFWNIATLIFRLIIMIIARTLDNITV